MKIKKKSITLERGDYRFCFQKKKEKKFHKTETSSFFCITSLDALVVSPKTLPYPPSDKSIIL